MRSAETIGRIYGGDSVKAYADRDKLLGKYNIVVDETESPYPRPTGRAGPRLTFHVIGQDLTIPTVEEGGFLLHYANISLRSLGWAKDDDVVNQHFPYGRSVHVHAYYYPKCLLIITRVVYCYSVDPTRI